jgi:hypothetical protein
MKKRSYALAGLTLLLAVAIAFLSGPLLDRLFAPWAFEHNGRPALTGSWVGLLTTATGQSHGVLLELLLPEPKGEEGLVRAWREAPYGALGGTARVCDQRGQVRSYTIEGEPEDRQATHLTFHANPSETPARDGLTISWVKGVWDGANTLDLRAQLYWEQDGSAVSGGSYPDTQSEAVLKMTRGDEEEFQAICDRVKQRSLENM